MRSNNQREQSDHPEPMLDIAENSWQNVEDFAKLHDISIDRAIQFLTFNELRCIHTHVDQFISVFLREHRHTVEEIINDSKDNS